MIEKSRKYLKKKINNAIATKDIERATFSLKMGYIVLWSMLFLILLHHMAAIWFLRAGFIRGMNVICLVLCVLSIAAFVFSTNYEYFNFFGQKRKGIIIIILFLVAAMDSFMSNLFCGVVLPVLFLIPIGHDITAGMVVWLSRFLYLLFMSVPAIYMGHRFVVIAFSEENLEKIMKFKLRKIADLRSNKKFRYDLSIIKKMENGSTYTIKEKDRQRHMLLSGVTGTGKTSSALIPAVARDLDKKAENEDYTKTQILKRIISQGDIHPKMDLRDEEFHIKDFSSDSESGRKFLHDLAIEAPSAGITVIAPNADFADAVYDLATIRGFKVNRVDPVPVNVATGEMKPGFIGFNPLYISPDFSEAQKKLEIFRKSRMFSDVLQALYEQSAKTDAYFTSLNRNLTTTLCILVLTTYPWLHEGKQPMLTDIQEVVNDFSCVRQYLFALAKIVGVGESLKGEWEVTMEWLKSHKFGEYQFIVSQVAYDLVGAGRTKMEDQARGLRIILNEFLTDPLVRKVVCPEKTVDIDRVLANGEITVVNYALEMGTSIATGLGQFFCLSFNQAVLRRPGNESNRLLHFYYCDEFPVLLHKDMEQIFTLFRQYRVCFTCAFQTFSQFDRNEVTKFLKKVVLSNVGHHIVYGNCSPEEMKLYEELAGKQLHFVEQETVTQTALSSADTSMSFSTRTTPEYANAIEGYKLRAKDFQEVTVFGVNDGDYVPPFDGKLSFLTQKEKMGKKRLYIDWSLYAEPEKEAEFKNIFTNVTKKFAGGDSDEMDISAMLAASRMDDTITNLEDIFDNKGAIDDGGYDDVYEYLDELGMMLKK